MNLQQVIRDRVHVQPNGCWDWSGHVNTNGYGRITIKGRRDYAHRLSYVAFNGALPAGAHVCHKCDRPICCNPAHLFAGTAADNMADCARKGRARGPKHLVGERHPRSKLTDRATDEIRALRGSGLLQRDVADRFGVSQSTISLIWLGKVRNATR